MKKVFLLLICCLSLCGCNNDKSKLDFQKKMLVCTITKETLFGKSNHVFKFQFEKNGTLKNIHHSYVSYFNSKEKALNYYLDFNDGTMEINENIITSSEFMDITNLLKSEKRGTYEKEKQFWESQGYDCQVRDTDE